MSKTLQIEVDPLLCASQERIVSGELSWSGLQRLKDIIDPSSEPIKAELSFTREGKFVVLMGRVSGDLVLQCAACLELLDFPIELSVKLAVISDESKVALLPDEYEPCLYNGERLLISDVVESELVLVIPTFARHDVCPTELPKDSTSDDFMLETEAKENPFKVLESLKKH